MDIYPADPQPQTVLQHNEWMNRAVLKWHLPLSALCPDCYQPVRICNHASEPELKAYLINRPKRGKT